MHSGRAAAPLAHELDTGNFSIGVRLDAGTTGSGQGNVTHKYVRKVSCSLSDVELYEIPLGANRKIYDKLMSREECNEAVMANICAGGYVCQGQQIMEATVAYDLKLQGGAGANDSGSVDTGVVTNAIKVAAHPEANVHLVEQAGRLVTGSALKYGIAVNPTCMAPPHARFQRILPKTRFDRFMNFVKFRLLEADLPAT